MAAGQRKNREQLEKDLVMRNVSVSAQKKLLDRRRSVSGVSKDTLW